MIDLLKMSIGILSSCIILTFNRSLPSNYKELKQSTMSN